MDPFQQKSSKEAHHPAPGLCYAHCHWIAFSGADVCCLIAPGSLSEQNWIHGVQASKETGGGEGGMVVGSGSQGPTPNIVSFLGGWKIASKLSILLQWYVL